MRLSNPGLWKRMTSGEQMAYDSGWLHDTQHHAPVAPFAEQVPPPQDAGS